MSAILMSHLTRNAACILQRNIVQKTMFIVQSALFVLQTHIVHNTGTCCSSVVHVVQSTKRDAHGIPQ